MTVYAVYNGTDVGTPLLLYDLLVVMEPGMSEATVPLQLAKARAYWTGVVATTHDGNLLAKAQNAVTWLTAELARVENPPTNTLRSVVPV
jgi:hypothetical protein